MSEYEQSVFISYAWGAEREDIVNEIDETLQQRGIRIVRDKRALGYRGSIKEFMERIGRGSCVIVVISDKYLRSPNCMFELVEIAENKQFHDRVFPVVLSDANIYDALKRIEYIKFWEGKRKELAKAMKTLDPANLQGIREEMDQYDRIRDKISGITSILKDMNTLTPDMHRDSEFSNLYDAIVERLKEGATDVTAEFNEIAQKAEAEHKAKEDREAKAEADRLAAQKAEEEAAAKARVEKERQAAQRAQEERLAREEAGRLAAPSAGPKPEQKETVAPSQPIPASTSQRKPASKVLIFGIVGIALLCVAGIVVSGLLSSMNSNTPPSDPATEPPAAQVNGFNVNRVLYPEGEFFQTDAQSWVERAADGTEFHYVETERDEWSVYLYDETRNYNIHLDLYQEAVYLDINDGTGEYQIFDIVGSEGQ
jgi:hypothetical protein